MIFKRLLLCLVACTWAAALQGSPRDALLLLKAECFGCHNPDKKKGDVILTSRASLLPNADKIIPALAPDADPHMPPKKQLTTAQTAILRDWIQRGAEWIEIEAPPVNLTAPPPNYRPSFALATTSNKVAVARGGTIQMYGIESNQLSLIKEFAAHTDPVQALAFSPDGQWLASGAFGKTVVWDAGLEITNQFVTALAFAPTGSLMAIADRENIEVYDIAARKKTASWRAHGDTIYDVEFSRDGQRLATASGDRLVRIWEVASQKEIATLEGHTAQVLAVAFNTNAAQVVSGGSDHVLTVWDIATREKISKLGRHSAAITAVTWPGDGSMIFAATEAGQVFSYKNLKRHSGEQSSASGDERKIADVDEPLWCLGTEDKLLVAAGQQGSIFAWDADGKQLAKFSVTNPPAVSAEVTRRTPQQQASSRRGHESHSNLEVRAITIDPPEIHLSLDEPFASILLGAQAPDGTVTDVTTAARYANNFSDVFEITPALQIRAKKPGRALLTAHYKGKRVDARVIVATNASFSGVSFVRDVLPALSKAGCNAGACHAKPEGQNGFKLSVFSYDPKSDYAEIVTDVRGRRIFSAAPEAGLLLQKPTASIPHEGGKRFEPDSETYNLLVSWIRHGMPYMLTNEPSLQSIEVFPKTRRYRKDARQPLLVRARYADGSIRDVTRLASFDSNDKELAKVDEMSGVLTIGSVSGQAVIVARYMGFVADSQVIIPSERVLPASQFVRLPRNNFIDDLAYKHFQSLGLFPAQLCSDAEFLRRAKLDTIGRLPEPEEVREFGTDNSSDKRKRAIARILDDGAYADYWANKWADLLRPNPDRVGVKSIFVLDQWLRASFRANKPYDQFVREILLAEGSNHREGPAVVYRDRREPPELTTMFSQLFLGTRLECARCHHHPNEKWSQDDFYQFAAFFDPVKRKGAGLSPPISAGRETFYFAPGGGGGVKHPVTQQTMSPRPPDGKALDIPEKTDPRRALADWLMSPDNPFFARAAVNRVWANFFGRGLVEPVDDFRISNPCVNEPLLDALARDFAAHKYDLKHLMRTIMESRLYQLSSTPNASNLADTKNFSRAYRRRLPAEVLLDAVDDATGVPSSFEAMPPASRAMQAWSYKIDSHFMDAFGRPNSSSDCPCERDTHMSVVQSLHLMHSKDLQAKLSNAKGRARKLAETGRTPQEIVTELYLATLSRFPTADEVELASEAFKDSREVGCEDVLWALLNSAEFVFNH